MNKIDLLPEEEVSNYCQMIVDELKWEGPVFMVSAIRKQGTNQLVHEIMDYLEEQKALDIEKEEQSEEKD